MCHLTWFKLISPFSCFNTCQITGEFIPDFQTPPEPQRHQPYPQKAPKWYGLMDWRTDTPSCRDTKLTKIWIEWCMDVIDMTTFFGKMCQHASTVQIVTDSSIISLYRFNTLTSIRGYNDPYPWMFSNFSNWFLLIFYFRKNRRWTDGRTLDTFFPATLLMETHSMHHSIWIYMLFMLLYALTSKI